MLTNRKSLLKGSRELERDFSVSRFLLPLRDHDSIERKSHSTLPIDYSRCNNVEYYVKSSHRCHCYRRRHLRRRQCCLRRRCRHRSLSPLSSPLSLSPVSVVAAQQWRRSDGQRRWRRSDGDGGAATAMGQCCPRQRHRPPPPLPYNDYAPPVPPSPHSGSRPRCRPPPPVLRPPSRPPPQPASSSPHTSLTF